MAHNRPPVRAPPVVAPRLHSADIRAAATPARQQASVVTRVCRKRPAERTSVTPSRATPVLSAGSRSTSSTIILL